MRDDDLGYWMTFYYNHYLDLYGDPELASVAAAATINNMLDAERSVEPL